MNMNECMHVNTPIVQYYKQQYTACIYLQALSWISETDAVHWTETNEHVLKRGEKELCCISSLLLQQEPNEVTTLPRSPTYAPVQTLPQLKCTDPSYYEQSPTPLFCCVR